MSPQIPVYNRQVRPTTQAPSAKRSESFAGATGQAIQGLGQALGQVAERMQRIEVLDKVTKLKTQANNSILGMQEKIQKNPEKWTEEIIAKETRKIQSNLIGQLSSIPDRETQIKARGALNSTFASGMVKFQNIRRTYTMRQRRANWIESLDSYEKRYANSLRPKERKNYVNQMDLITKEVVADGSVSPLDAKNELEERIEGLERFRLSEDRTSLRPGTVLQKLQNDEYDIPREEKKEQIEDIEKELINNAEKRQIELQDYTDQAEVSALRRLFDPNTDKTKLRQDVEKGIDKEAKGIEARIGRAIIEASKSKKAIAPEPDGEVYINLFSKGVEIKDEYTTTEGKIEPRGRVKLKKYVLDIVNNYKEGKIDSKQAGRLLKPVEAMYQELMTSWGYRAGALAELFPRANREDFSYFEQLKENSRKLLDGISYLADWKTRFFGKDETKIVPEEKFIDKIEEGDDPNEAVEAAKQESLEDFAKRYGTTAVAIESAADYEGITTREMRERLKKENK